MKGKVKEGMTTEGPGARRKRGRGRPANIVGDRTSPQVVEDALQVADASTTNTGTGEVEEMVVTPGPEPLPKGVDSGDLFASEDEQELEIVHKGQTWTFRYRDLTWGDKNYCIDQAQQWEGDQFKFSVQRYFAAALTRMIISSPIRPITELTLQKLDRVVGEKLITIVPSPVEETAALDEVKKV